MVVIVQIFEVVFRVVISLVLGENIFDVDRKRDLPYVFTGNFPCQVLPAKGLNSSRCKIIFVDSIDFYKIGTSLMSGRHPLVD